MNCWDQTTYNFLPCENITDQAYTNSYNYGQDGHYGINAMELTPGDSIVTHKQNRFGLGKDRQ